MLYQKLLVGEKPYHISSGYPSAGFENHRHPEVELYYCAEGNHTLRFDQTDRELTSGNLAVIGAMNAHESLKNETGSCRVLMAKVGPVFLAEYFDALEELARNNPVIQFIPGQDDAVLSILQKLIEICNQEDPIAKLETKGLLYQLCAALLRYFDEVEQVTDVGNELRAVQKVELALGMIYEQYQSGVTVEQAATLCGYSKSSFCRVFKRITGSSFHQVLNAHRIEIACALLKKTDSSVEEIAEEVGFTDTKSFCRVFKKAKGVSAGQYRRNSSLL